MIYIINYLKKPYKILLKFQVNFPNESNFLQNRGRKIIKPFLCKKCKNGKKCKKCAHYSN